LFILFSIRTFLIPSSLSTSFFFSLSHTSIIIIIIVVIIFILGNALFMKEGTMHVELKNGYGYCAYENGRTLASHNKMYFFMSDACGFQVAKKGMFYTQEYLTSLADEVWESRERIMQAAGDKKASSFLDINGSGECTFAWPAKATHLTEEGKVLTKVEQSTCYLDMTHAGWYQLKAKETEDQHCNKVEGAMANEGFEKDVTGFFSCPAMCVDQ
jgi:hypothetical protein